MNLLPVTCTVKPVLRGHLWDNEKVALQDRTIKRHSFNTGDCLIEVEVLNRGDHMGRFDCIFLIYCVQPSRYSSTHKYSYCVQPSRYSSTHKYSYCVQPSSYSSTQK